MNAPSASDIAFFRDNGFAIASGLIEPSWLEDAYGSYERILAADDLPEGVELDERAGLGLEEPQRSMIRIKYPHLYDAAVRKVIEQSPIGAWAAALLGVRSVQVFFAHMIHKPPARGDKFKVGWHQDGQYTAFFEGDFVTAWIPFTPISADSSPLDYVAGSHRYTIVGGSSISQPGSLDQLKANMLARCDIEWRETPVTGPLGTVGFHHSRTIHGSRPNFADYPRRSLTVHMRGETNRYREDNPDEFASKVIKSPAHCPVIYGSPDDFTDIGDAFAVQGAA